MGEIHQLIIQHGLEEARRLAGPDERQFVDLAAGFMSDQRGGIGTVYAGFAAVGLPHKRLPDDALWERKTSRVSLIVEPGAIVDRGAARRVGVPFGARARLVLAYLQTQALRSSSPEIELGRSMAEWMSRMGINDGGKDYRDVREQTLRLSACRLTFHWSMGGGRDGFARQSLVDGGIALYEPGDARQPRLFVDTVRLSDGFFRALREHPVPLDEAAVRALSGKSLALDVYCWLAYRLHSLERDTAVSWPALYEQHGAGFAQMFHFKPKFLVALRSAMAVYERASVTVEKAGLVLRPSPPPVAYRDLARVRGR